MKFIVEIGKDCAEMMVILTVLWEVQRMLFKSLRVTNVVGKKIESKTKARNAANAVTDTRTSKLNWL